MAIVAASAQVCYGALMQTMIMEVTHTKAVYEHRTLPSKINLLAGRSLEKGSETHT